MTTTNPEANEHRAVVACFRALIAQGPIISVEENCDAPHFWNVWFDSATHGEVCVSIDATDLDNVTARGWISKAAYITMAAERGSA